MKKFIPVFICIIFNVVFVGNLSAQEDSVRFDNGDLIVGEIKSMNKGILTLKTGYSDVDFKIEWDKVKWIHTQTSFLISISKSDNIYWGRLMSSSDSIVDIVVRSGMLLESSIDDIVDLDPIEDKFKDRWSASVDIGFDQAKAKNLTSISTRIGVGYKADRWSSDISMNSLYSRQDESDEIKRLENTLNYRYVFTRGSYGIATVSTLSNTEQKLDIRFNSQVGFGQYLLRNNHSYFGLQLGLNRNLENYSNETEDRNSWEGFVGAELNMFDTGDLSMNTQLLTYPGITEKGRWRSDLKLDVKYDFFKDFYIKLGFSLNYDNQPAVGATETDYVIQTGFGWEL
ncbi:DUF481 domain-containing protein [Labilibacter sediminis]|nr:DUF481 domain-containing protein [Labilibacter sediminis]